MNSPALTFDLPGSDATVALGNLLATTRPSPAVVHLHGELGAGKSTLARAMLRTLGVTGTVRSPTYTLVEDYELADGGRALHLDLYRIGDAGELEFLGLTDADATLWLVEWPERGSGALPAPDLEIRLWIEGEGRQACCQARTPAGEDWIRRLEADDRLQALVAAN